MNGKRLANRIVMECEKMGAEDVRLIDVRSRSPFFDFLVIATVDNTVLADALLARIRKEARPDAGVAVSVESGPESDWVVCDYGDTIFHVFVGGDVREYYDLESLWSPHDGVKRQPAGSETDKEES